MHEPHCALFAAYPLLPISWFADTEQSPRMLTFSPGATKSTKPAGRPVGIVIGTDGSMYISDDKNGAVYRVTYAGK